VSEALYINPRTGRSWPASEPLWRAPDDGGPLELSPGAGMCAAEIDSRVHSLWRYAAALRVGPPRVTLGEGWTALLDIEWCGLRVYAKADHLMPTGSFKDRGTAVMLNYLLDRGIECVVDDTSGNMGASLATYAAATRARCRIFCPESTTPEKIAQMRSLGADVHTVPGARDRATDAASSQPAPWFYASHILQPFFLEGTKTVAYELWEQLGFTAPDAVIAPLGQGGNILGLHIGFSELLRSGAIASMPRLYAVQAANCAPFAHAYSSGSLEGMTVTPTIAAGIASARPARLEAVIAAVRGSRGSIISVSEEEIRSALQAFLERGLYVEPTTAVVGAAARRLAARGAIEPRQKVALLLTGHGLKAAQTVAKLVLTRED
jgi:threonine synthase